MNDCTSQDHNRGPTLILMILAPELRRGLPCKVPMSARANPRQLARPSALREVTLGSPRGVPLSSLLLGVVSRIDLCVNLGEGSLNSLREPSVKWEVEPT